MLSLKTISDVVIVLGMHRSGTSAVSGVFSKLGCAPPKSFMGGDEYNKKGYFESKVLMELHDKILASAGTTWRDWRSINSDWYRSFYANEFKTEAIALFQSEFFDSAFPVFKDPRICRFMPFWLDVFRQINIEPHVAFPVRSPLEVAYSLQTRNGMSLPEGLLIWLRHNLDAERATRGLNRSIFLWNDFQEDWRIICKKIASDAQIHWVKMSDETAMEIDNFLSKDLVHHNASYTDLLSHPDVSDLVVRAFDAFQILAANPNSNLAHVTLDDIAQKFDESCDLFGRLLADQDAVIQQIRAVAEGQNKKLEEMQAHSAAKQSEHDSQLQAVLQRAETAENQVEEKDKHIHSVLLDREAWSKQNAELTERINVLESQLLAASLRAASVENQVEERGLEAL